ncbi:MAG: flagellar export protein FliJ [Alphaproteobacteria bacterium]|nr:flagellar export protein FliJ [Alphaproteobacteria bacterium]MBU1515474.1 flagellar export protein FliJ [Alphaproteobacteria bacterium]MBU2095472.1 flagellar export protein FliJ [Alphaproteobacteria bacterium]MBU2150713.1 flagellar export protein FliJ [Alphaproteobacteria bacterium]MBU2306978.1 flagellar export protein FliJ [Alphaproteobacteria bacterium]
MSWAESLIKLSTYEAEVLQKRLAEIVDRRVAVEMRLACLEAEGEAEAGFSAQEAAAGIYRAGFFEGLKMRKARVQSEIDVILIEETGAREALAEAFETQKKYEHIALNLQIEARKVQGRRDSAALDELGLRKKAG